MRFEEHLSILRPGARLAKALVLAFSLATPLVHSADSDWIMFRGNPSLTGAASGSLESKLGLLWTFKTGRPVKSSPALRGERVYVGSDDGNLYALDLTKGPKAWEFKTEGAVESSPLVLGNRVYFGSTDTFLYAVDSDTGKLAWNYYQYGEGSFVGPTSPRYFHANNATFSLRWAF